MMMQRTIWNNLHYIHDFSIFNQKVSGLELGQDGAKSVPALNQ